MQETYLKAYKFIENYDQGTNSKAWLFKILKNAYINEYHRRAGAFHCFLFAQRVEPSTVH